MKKIIAIALVAISPALLMSGAVAQKKTAVEDNSPIAPISPKSADSGCWAKIADVMKSNATNAKKREELAKLKAAGCD